jgi:transcriptional regulator with GAF, ATPase, and Fis domain
MNGEDLNRSGEGASPRLEDGPANGTATVLADLLASLAAIGNSMQEAFDPQRFLGQFSARIQRLIPHDRLVLDHLDEDCRTFTVFAEHAPHGPVLHAAHYTTAFDPEGRYIVADWAVRPVFSGEQMRVDDLRTDPRFANPNPHERTLQEGGLRSAIIVPLASGGRVIGALAATSLAPGAYTASHVTTARRVADLIAPFIENVVLLHRERRRRRRFRALAGLTQVLGASLNVRDIFKRLADATRPILDFDIMGFGLVASSGRDLELVAEVDDAPGDVETPPRFALDDYSFSSRVAAGEAVLIHDARVELDPKFPVDRLIIDGGGRSCLVVPLMFGEQSGGGLYFGKRRPNWFDRSDVEVATGIAAQVVGAVQHQRLAEEQRRLAQAEGRARKLEQRVASLRSALGEQYGFDRIVGRSPSLKEALSLSGRVAPTETTVLITGESGTGKELAAQAIHANSPRADGAFVTLNCAALPETLLESELFGHEKGAFTGADRQKPGRFELAAGGTLFLDEVGELPPPVQAKLLRVLQDGEFVRVGGTATLRADVRIIAATNRNLEQAVESGQFRQDLFYRLNVFRIHLPPLRDRGEDVLLLAEHFVRELGPRMGKGEVGLSREARTSLLSYAWPGNIRELRNVVERALIMSDGGLVTAAQLGISARGELAPTGPGQIKTSDPGAPDQPLSEVEKRLVFDALGKARGNKSRAASLLGITRSQLYTRLKRYGLDA